MKPKNRTAENEVTDLIDEKVKYINNVFLKLTYK